MNKLIKTLVSFGLTEKEAGIYLALYKLGEATGYQVAKESGVKRPTVYVIMEELRKRGLALVIPHAKKQLFVAKDPQEFIQEYQSKTNENTRSLLTLLPKLSHPATDTVVFKGQGALVQGLAYGLNGIKDTEVIAFFAPVSKGVKVAQEYHDHYDDFNRLGLTLRSVIPTHSYDSDFRETDRKYGFRTRKIPRELFSPAVSIEVVGDLSKVVIHKKKEVIAIKNQGVADLYRQLFEMVWNMAQ